MRIPTLAIDPALNQVPKRFSKKMMIPATTSKKSLTFSMPRLLAHRIREQNCSKGKKTALHIAKIYSKISLMGCYSRPIEEAYSPLRSCVCVRQEKSILFEIFATTKILFDNLNRKI